jgi:hypothetical protein
LKILLYMTGSYAKILRHCPGLLPEIEIASICPNWQSFQESKKEKNFSSVDYIYEGFNQIFKDIDIEEFCEKYASINLYEVLQVDKTHFKKQTGEYQLRYICTIGRQLERIFQRIQPGYIVFPIIETIDAMLAYRMAPLYGIKPVVYGHARFANLSFFSESHREFLPSYAESLNISEGHIEWANKFLKNYRENPGPFNYKPTLTEGDGHLDFEEASSAFHRLLRNIWLKMRIEKHNQMISLWIRFQVHFQHIFLPVRRQIFKLVEKYKIKPLPAPAGAYDFFPLHFSPESSINVPAPYYIDQTRVVDRILLERQDNRTLVLKEHPAMFGFRDGGFYDSLIRRPFIQFVHRTTPSYQLIKNANTVYSVTGTACLEAFFFGVNWVQFGENFLSDWKRSREKAGLSVSPVEFIAAVREASSDFVLYSPGRSPFYDRILFSKSNLQKMCDHLRFHLKHDEKNNANIDGLARNDG